MDDEVMMDAGADTTSRLKSQATVRKGRGFGGRGDRDEEMEGGFDTIEAEDGTGLAQRSVEGWIVLVTGVHEEATEEDVTDKFADFGEIKNSHLNLDRRTGYVKGYALIEYATFKEAKAAIDEANNTELLGKVVNVDFAFIRGPGGSKVTQEVTVRQRRDQAHRRDENPFAGGNRRGDGNGDGYGGRGYQRSGDINDRLGARR